MIRVIDRKLYIPPNEKTLTFVGDDNIKIVTFAIRESDLEEAFGERPTNIDQYSCYAYTHKEGATITVEHGLTNNRRENNFVLFDWLIDSSFANSPGACSVQVNVHLSENETTKIFNSNVDTIIIGESLTPGGYSDDDPQISRFEEILSAINEARDKVSDIVSEMEDIVEDFYTKDETDALLATKARISSPYFEGQMTVYGNIDAVGRLLLREGFSDTGVEIDAMSGKITGLTGTPTSSTDAATKGYVDDGLAGKADASALDLKLDKTGGTMTGAIDMNGYKINGLAEPTVGTDAATKGYVDASYSPLSGNIQAVALIANNAKSTADAVTREFNSFRANLTYETIGAYPKTGGLINGDVRVNGSISTARNPIYVDGVNGRVSMNPDGSISGVTSVSNLTDAANKQYVDTECSAKVDKSGDTMTGDLNMSEKSISNVGKITFVNHLEEDYGSMRIPPRLVIPDDSWLDIDGDLRVEDVALNGTIRYPTVRAIPSDPRDTELVAFKQVKAYVEDVISDIDAYTKDETDALLNRKLNLTGGTMTGNINMSDHKLQNVSSITMRWYEIIQNGQATMVPPTIYIDNTDLYMDVVGTVRFGGYLLNNPNYIYVDGGSGRITGLLAPTAGADAVNKTYTDALLNQKLNLTGGTVTGDLSVTGEFYANAAHASKIRTKSFHVTYATIYEETTDDVCYVLDFDNLDEEGHQVYTESDILALIPKIKNRRIVQKSGDTYSYFGKIIAVSCQYPEEEGGFVRAIRFLVTVPPIASGEVDYNVYIPGFPDVGTVSIDIPVEDYCKEPINAYVGGRQAIRNGDTVVIDNISNIELRKFTGSGWFDYETDWVAKKSYVDAQIGNITTSTAAIIALQNAYINGNGGNA